MLKNVHLAEARRSFFVLTHKERSDLEGPWGENALGTTLEPQLVSRGDFRFRGKKVTPGRRWVACEAGEVDLI